MRNNRLLVALAVAAKVARIVVAIAHSVEPATKRGASTAT